MVSAERGDGFRVLVISQQNAKWAVAISRTGLTCRRVLAARSRVRSSAATSGIFYANRRDESRQEQADGSARIQQIIYVPGKAKR